MKTIYKYATGAPVPEGAIYLNTVTQTKEPVERGEYSSRTVWVDCWYVWHYFLVEVKS